MVMPVEELVLPNGGYWGDQACSRHRILGGCASVLVSLVDGTETPIHLPCCNGLFSPPPLASGVDERLSQQPEEACSAGWSTL
jgi:hypothetical protein